MAFTAGDRMLTYEDAARRLHISPRTLRRMVDRGEFPAPVRVSARSVRFSLAEVDAYLDDLLNSRKVGDG